MASAITRSNSIVHLCRRMASLAPSTSVETTPRQLPLQLQCTRNPIISTGCKFPSPSILGGFLSTWSPLSAILQTAQIHCSAPQRSMTLLQMHLRGPPKRRRRRRCKLGRDRHFMAGVVLKVLILHPKKPNSGNRKCVLVKLTNGNEEIAYIPGEGHNLQEHSQVLVENKRKRDLIGVRLQVVRGALDCALVKKKTATG